MRKPLSLTLIEWLIVVTIVVIFVSVFASLSMKNATLITTPSAAASTTVLASPFASGQFREIHSEFWGTWKLYVLRHQSGACFVAMWPNGEGAGTLTQAEPRVCGEKSGPAEHP